MNISDFSVELLGQSYIIAVGVGDGKKKINYAEYTFYFFVIAYVIYLYFWSINFIVTKQTIFH